MDMHINYTGPDDTLYGVPVEGTTKEEDVALRSYLVQISKERHQLGRYTESH